MLSADNTTASFGADSNPGDLFAALTAGAFPAPAQLSSIANANQGPAITALTDPVLTLTPGISSDLTIPSVSALIGYDAANSRIFGVVNDDTFAWSDDMGQTVSQGAVFSGEELRAVAVAGNFLFLATRSPADNSGKIYRCPRTGPYASGNFTAVLTGQEGYSIPWNLVAYDDGVVFAGNYTAPTTAQVRVRRSLDFGSTWTIVLDLGPGGTNAEHVHSVLRDPDAPNRVYVNVGDRSPLYGVYTSTDGGTTFSYRPELGRLRLTPLVKTSEGVIWGSDQYGAGGNLWLYDPVADTFTPRSFMTPPFYGDVFAMSTDASGLIWFMNRGLGPNSNRRAGIFVSADDGNSSYLVADLGSVLTDTLTLFRVGNYLFTGDGKRYPVGNLSVPVASPSPTPTPAIFQFSAPSYSFPKSCGATFATVVRSGDTTMPVSVEYATADGTATQKNNYTIASGVLNFQPQETSKLLPILVNNNELANGTESLSIALGNPMGGAILGPQSSATLQITDESTTTSSFNPIDGKANFVCQQYHDFLNRAADSAGDQFWVSQIGSCGNDSQCVAIKRINVSAAFFLSIEFQNTGYFVYLFHKASYGTLPRYADFMPDSREISEGVVVGQPGWQQTLESNKISFADEWANGPSFSETYGGMSPPAWWML